MKRGTFPFFIALNDELTNEKIRDDFLVFTAGDCMDAEGRATQELLPKCGFNTVLNSQFVI